MRRSEWRHVNDADTLPPREWGKLVLLGAVLAASLLSWFVDPVDLAFGRTTSERINPLHANVPFGVPLESGCKSMVQANRECRAAHPTTRPAATPDEAKGWMALVRQAGGMSEDSQPAAADPCADSAGKLAGCRSAVREARSWVQLRCNTVIMALWRCQHNHPAHGDLQCDSQQTAVHECAARVANARLGRFGVSFDRR